MFQFVVYKKDERFTWDKLKESEKDHKILQEFYVELNQKYFKMFKKVVIHEKHITIIQSQSAKMNEGGGMVLFPCPSLQDLSASKEIICILITCPLCRLWVGCNHFLQTHLSSLV